MTKSELTAAAEALEWVNALAWGPTHALEVAAARAKELRAQAAALKAPEPVAQVRINPTGGNVGIAWMAAPLESAPMMMGGELLYLAPPDQSARIASLESLLREALHICHLGDGDTDLHERIRAALERP
jgi:hypothetical protein